MMNYIWGGMLFLGILFSIINGKVADFTDGLMQSCSQGVQFIIGLSGIFCVWSGLMNIAEKSGLINKIATSAMPVIHFLFPEENNKNSISMMLMSFTANIFGAGNSATVFSLKAMQLLDEENQHSVEASNTMCMFLATSMSMLQLVPIAMMKIRSDLGSVDPGSIIVPSILSGLVSMAVSIFICKFYEKRSVQK